MPRIFPILTLILSCGMAALGQQQTGTVDLKAKSPTHVTDFESVRRAKVYNIRRTDQHITVDGNPDEAAWTNAEIGGDFYESDPVAGAPASERTEFRMLYDEENIYISVVCYQTDPIIISELKRDFSPADGDIVTVVFDTFDDQRTGFAFQTNPGSALRDQQINGAQRSQDWDGIWYAASVVQAPGWTSEMEIPLKTLRFDTSRPEQQWGLNVQRIIRYKNEWTLWSPMPRPFQVFDTVWAGSLNGLEELSQGRNLYIKPFAVANYRPNVGTGLLKKKEVSAGLDVKYGLTSKLTVDLTTNTDFSQVEADEQQVNLTRFSLFFPEKREFFLENAGLFDVGASNQGGPPGGRGGGGGGSGGGRGGARDIIPFFSRRIGLSDNGDVLPIRFGARVTGKALGMNVAATHMVVGSLGDNPANNWTVVRLQREFLQNSDFGVLAMNRDSATPGDWNRSLALDGNLRVMSRKLTLGGFAMKTQTPGPDKNDLAGRFEGTYQDSVFTYRSSYTTIQENFKNDFGFVPRGDIQKVNGFFGVHARPRNSSIREIFPQFDTNYIMDQTGRLVTRNHRAGASINFQSGDFLNFNRNMNFERLDSLFEIHTDIDLPPGIYTFNDWDLGFNSSRGRRFFGGGGYKSGTFWSGNIRETRTNFGWRQSIHFQTNVNWNRDTVRLPQGDFKTDLVGARFDFAFSPRMFLDSFIQYNTNGNLMTTNVRFRFIHHPLSDFYIVYNEARGISGNTDLSRTVSVKVTHLFAF
jgi:hypothetical protein